MKIMLRWIGAGVWIMASIVAAQAAIEVQSKVDAVTVFPRGAEVARIARVKLGAGSYQLLFRDIPATAIGRSVRVEGQATGRLQIGSVDTRVLYVPRADAQQQASKRRELEKQIEALKDERQTYKSEVAIGEAQKRFATNLVKLPVSGAASGGRGQTVVQEDWSELSSLIVGQITAAEKALNAARIKIREVDRKIKDLRKKMSQLPPRVRRRMEVKVTVVAAQALEADLTVRYQVRGARWRAHYDGRLSTGTRGQPPTLAITRRAAITQRTGEAWNNIKLSLSTTRATAGTSAPNLGSLKVDYPPPAPKLGTNKYSTRGFADQRRAEKAPAPAKPQALEARAKRKATKRTAVSGRLASVQKSRFQVVYAVPGRVTIPATGQAKRVAITSTKITPKLSVRAVPRRQMRAYLYLSMKVPKGEPFLPGRIALFRDGTFIGNGHLPQLAGGEKHELGFGVDTAVQIKFAVLKEKRGESGLISSSHTDERNFRITIKNLRDRAIAYKIFDHVPVSLNEEIRVNTTFKPAPTKRNFENRQGVMVWEKTLKPGGEQGIEIGYTLTWPSGKTIRYR